MSIGWISWILVIVVFYIFLIMPEQRKQKKLRTLIQSAKVGDNIMTRGGLYGKITAINDDQVIMETGPDKVKIAISKFSISTVVQPAVEEPEEKKEEYTEVK